MHLDNGRPRSLRHNRVFPLRTIRVLTNNLTSNLTRKRAKPARRFVLTAGLAASAFVTCAFLRHPSMAITTAERTVSTTRIVQTRSLFHYHRDDNTPDKITTVHIDAAQQATASISPNIFGNFIEHLGGVVYQALWS